MENTNEVMELSTQELDSVAGGAIRFDIAEVQNTQELQSSKLIANRNGIISFNVQSTDDFSAAIAEFNQTGKLDQ